MSTKLWFFFQKFWATGRAKHMIVICWFTRIGKSKRKVTQHFCMNISWFGAWDTASVRWQNIITRVKRWTSKFWCGIENYDTNWGNFSSIIQYRLHTRFLFCKHYFLLPHLLYIYIWYFSWQMKSLKSIYVLFQNIFTLVCLVYRAKRIPRSPEKTSQPKFEKTSLCSMEAVSWLHSIEF